MAVVGSLFKTPSAGPEARGDVTLNPEQRRAVEHGEGPLVVVAGAGTGKTRVIVHRIERLLATRPDLSAGEILALTFTRKAAGEMAWRVHQTLGERGKGLVATTFHAFAKDILQEVNPALRQIDEVEHWILLRRSLARLGLVRYRKLAEPGQFLTDFTKFFSRCQDELVSPEEYLHYAQSLAVAAGQDADARDEAEKQLEIARAYLESERLLREKNLLTFGGSIIEMVRLLQRDPERLAALRRRFRFILVDEFQDTNVAQIRLLGLLAGKPRNLFVVGDDDQAIYRFRGASFGSFRIFEREFQDATQTPPGVGAQGRLLLTRNYRSTKRILKLADAVIRNNGSANRLFSDKRLFTSNPEGARIQIASLRGPAEEAEWITQQIEAEHARGQKWESFAVLYRTHAHREELVQTLLRHGIPFVIRRLSMLTSPVVRDLLAALRWVDWPGDNAAFARVMALPRWGLAARDVVRLGHHAARNPRSSLWNALGELGAAGAAPAGASALLALHEQLADLAGKQPALAVFDALTAALEMLPLPEGPARRAFAAFRGFLEEWQAASERKDLHAFLEYFRYFEQAGGSLSQDEEFEREEGVAKEERAGDAVQLMTAHGSKGLEFDHVFVMRLCRNAFPVSRKKPLFEFPPALMKEELPKGDHHVLEERRLFYVALTRARKRLTLTTVEKERSKPSLFLEDIEQEMHALGRDVEKLVPEVSLQSSETVSEETRKIAGRMPALARTPVRAAGLFGDAAAAEYQTSRIGAWAGDYRPPVERPLELSASSVETYCGCPLKFMFDNRWGIRGRPSGSLTFGNVMHTTIRHFMKELREGRRPTVDDVLLVYEREWKSIGFEDEYQEESFREAGREQLRKFHARTMAALPAVRDLEKYFALPLANDLMLTGRIDQINALPGGAEIVDYKTGTPRTEKYVKKDLQLSVYALAAREALELSVARVAFHYLQDDSVVTAERDAKDLAEAESRIQEAAAGIRGGQFPARPQFLCRYCDFRLICPAHEQPLTAVASPSEPA